MALRVRRVVALLAVLAAGCMATRSEDGEAVVRLVPAPALTSKPEPKYRWRDCLGQPYSEAFRKSFDYRDAEVNVRFSRRAAVFRGTIVARKLKPNFAYQVKLVGMPPSLWGRRGDAFSNRAIGDLGRWWKPGPDARNAYYIERDEDKDLMEGYLVIGYFVTDAEGKAAASFAAENSFHVLWRTSQWPKGADDSAPTRHPIVARAGSYGYDRDFPDGELELYAEAERGRPPIGKALLPPGRYRCFFLLTEESFHDYLNPDGGDWAAALAAIVEFVITVDFPNRSP